MLEPKPKPRKPGRPKLAKGEAKGKTVQVRFTADDHKRFSTVARSNQQTLSDWIRSTLDTAAGAQ